MKPTGLALWLGMTTSLAGCQSSEKKAEPERSSPADGSSLKVVAFVHAKPIRARVPPGLADDPKRYRSFVLEHVYRHQALALARKRGFSLSAEERTAVKARVPPASKCTQMLKREKMTYDELVQRDLDVALIQKLERSEVFARVKVDREALRAQHAKSPLQGPRHYVTAVRTDRRCDGDAPDTAGLDRLAAAALDGHRLALAADGLPAMDLHFGDDGSLRYGDMYRRDPQVSAPAPDVLAKLGRWATSDSKSTTTLCSDGVVWIARHTARAPPGPLAFEDAVEELEARARTERRRGALDAWVDRVLADADPDIVTPR